MTEEGYERKVSSSKGIFNANIKSTITAFLTAGAIVGAIYVAYLIPVGERPTTTNPTNQVIQRNVMRGEKPEIYIEYRGIRYYSRIDGKEISDVVK